MRTTARPYIDADPELGAETKRYMVDCKFWTTRLWFSLQKHEDECGRCNLARLWREHGSPEMKAEVDRLHSEIQERMVAAHLAGRRN